MLTHLFDVLQYANGKGSVSYTEENTVKNKRQTKRAKHPTKREDSLCEKTTLTLKKNKKEIKKKKRPFRLCERKPVFDIPPKQIPLEQSILSKKMLYNMA